MHARLAGILTTLRAHTPVCLVPPAILCTLLQPPASGGSSSGHGRTYARHVGTSMADRGQPATTAAPATAQQQQQQQQQQQAAANSSTKLDLLKEGPYVYSIIQDHVTSTRPAPHHARGERPVRLPLFATVPMTASPGSDAPPGPFPVCVLLNGFQARASYYSPLARRLASWGVVVLQYNAPALTIIPDAHELPFLGQVLQWLKAAATSEAAQPALRGRADLGRLVVAGHSRGGKLAALHYAGGAVAGIPIRAAFLIDPVDNTSFTPESAEYPSASKALAAAGRPFGLAAAGLVGSSNPEGSNWQLFQAAQAAGSWSMVLRAAGHTTFMQPPTMVETWILDRVFGGGKMRRDVAISETAAGMLAWFQHALSPATGSAAAPAPASAAAAGGGAGAVAAAAAAAASAARVPIASAGLGAVATLTAPATTTAAAAAGDLGGSEAGDFSRRVQEAFWEWVTSPLGTKDVEFVVKGA